MFTKAFRFENAELVPSRVLFWRHCFSLDPMASDEAAAPIAPMTPKKRCGMGRSPGLPDPETGVLAGDRDSTGVPGCPGGGCGGEEYLMLETTAETGAQRLTLRQSGLSRPHGTFMSLTADALPCTSACQPKEEEATSPSKRPQAELRHESKPGCVMPLALSPLRFPCMAH